MACLVRATALIVTLLAASITVGPNPLGASGRHFDGVAFVHCLLVRKDQVPCVPLEPSERPIPFFMPLSNRTNYAGRCQPGTVPCVWLVMAGFRGNVS